MGSCQPCKENFRDEEKGLCSLREREIILKIALKQKWAKSQKQFKSWIEGRQPCTQLNKLHSYTAVVNPDLDYLFFRKYSFCGCCSQQHHEQGSAWLRVLRHTGSPGLETPPGAGRGLSGSVERSGPFPLPGKHRALAWVRVACGLPDDICHPVILPRAF